MWRAPLVLVSESSRDVRVSSLRDGVNVTPGSRQVRACDDIAEEVGGRRRVDAKRGVGSGISLVIAAGDVECGGMGEGG